MKAPFAFFTTTAARKLAIFAVLAVSPAALHAAIPPVENLLPADTLFVVSTPDWTSLRAAYGKSPYSQFLSDPAMKPIREKFVTKWNEEFVAPLERDLGVKFENYGELAQGQFTFAITQDGWEGGFDQIPAVLILLDTKEKSGQLKTTLAELRRKWVDSGKTVKTETVRDVEFWIVPMSSNNVPRTLQKYFPQRQEIHEIGEEKDKKPPQDEIVVGQCQSLLIIGSSLRAAEKVVARLTGGSAPALADEAAFDASKNALFRDAPLFAWFNAKRFFDVILALPEPKPNPEAPSPFPTFDVGKIITATGLGGLKTVALAWRSLSEGSAFDLYISAPESGRTGFLKILAPDAKDSNPPAFVPADVVKFQRWRMDGQKAVATLEKMAGEIQPAALRVWNYLIKTGNDAAGENEAGFDMRQRLFGNLGDDLISYTKPPRDNTRAQLDSPPSITLIGSSNAEQMAAALKGLLVFVSPYITPKEREFLGRKIYTITVTRSFIGASGVRGRELTYSASGGYLAITTDATLLEEFLRSSETPPKPLRDLPGLADASQMVGGQNTGLFNYENQAGKMRIAFQLLKGSGGVTNDSVSFNPLPGLIPFAGPEKSMKEWLDFSLLPDFDKVSKYFSYAVYSGSASPDGIKFKFFTPTPPELKE